MGWASVFTGDMAVVSNSNIFISKFVVANSRFTVFIIIATYNLIPISTVCMFLVCLCIWFIIIGLTTRYLFCYGLEVCIDHKWHGLLFMKIIEFQYIVILIRHFYCLCTIYLNAIIFMIVQDSFRAETLKTMHTEVLFFPHISFGWT